MALRRGPLRVGVDLMLEVVHHRAVRQEGQRAGEVAVEELARVRTEKAVRPRLREKLHAHRVDLAGLHAGPDIFQRHAVAVGPAGEGVARLVGDDLDVVLGAVEVCEDEGDLIVHDRGAVAAAGFALRGEHVHQAVAQHLAEEHRRLRAELAVELHALCQNVVRRARRTRVSAAELQRGVGKAHRILLADALGLTAIDLRRDGDDIFPHRGAEGLDVLLRVAVSAHAVIAELGIAVVAELAAHRVAQLHELVIDAVEVRLMLLIPCALGLPSGEAAGIVRVGLEGAQLGERVGLALKRDLGGGDELLVFLRQLVFLLQLADDLRGEGLARDLRVDEHQVAEFRREVRAEGAFEHRGGPSLRVFLQLRSGIVPEGLLRVIECVARVDAVAHGGERRRRVEVLLLGLPREEGLARLGVSLRRLQLLRQRRKTLLERLHVGADIGHFGKFHCVILLWSEILVLTKPYFTTDLYLFAILGRIRYNNLNHL